MSTECQPGFWGMHIFNMPFTVVWINVTQELLLVKDLGQLWMILQKGVHLRAEPCGGYLSYGRCGLKLIVRLLDPFFLLFCSLTHEVSRFILPHACHPCTWHLDQSSKATQLLGQALELPKSWEKFKKKFCKLFRLFCTSYGTMTNTLILIQV